jgi:uncharacterized membrane protein YeaQ/YmgE (transglycosylase-associated protein family)
MLYRNGDVNTALMYIDVTSLLVWIVVGLIAGFLAGKVMTGHGFGLIVDLMFGIAGAFLGGFLAGLLGLHATSILGEIVVAFLGAVVLLLVLRLVSRGSRRRRAF